MITSTDNEQLKTIRKLHDKRWRNKLDLFLAEGEDLVAAAEAAGWQPEFVLAAGEDVEPALLDQVSTLGSGTRVIGVYRRRWSEKGGALSVFLDGVADPGNVGTIIRSAHALADGPVIIGPGTADPFAPKAVRATMGSLFARPPARPGLEGEVIVLDASAETPLAEISLRERVTVCVGAERGGRTATGRRARIPQRADGPDSLNAAMAATVALYELANRMARHA